MAQHRRLGLTGGATGVQQHRDVVRVAAEQIGLLSRRISGGVEQLDTWHIPDALDGTDPLGHALADHDGGGGGASHDGPQLLVRQAVVHGHERLPGQRRAPQGQGHGDRVEVDHPHPLSGLGGQPGTGPLGVGSDIGHRQPVLAGAQGQPVGHALGGHLQQQCEMHGPLRQLPVPAHSILAMG